MFQHTYRLLLSQNKGNRMKTLSVALIALFMTAVTYAQVTWSFDNSHSKVGFTVDHLVISEVDGHFRSYEGTISSTKDNDFSNAQINFTIKANSINTENEDRDKHLRSADFFDVEKYPNITFVSKSMTKQQGNKYKVTGDFTMKGVTKSITFDAVMSGPVKDPWGNTKIAFKLKGELNRFDYGLQWSKATEAGGLVVGKEVRFDIDVQLKKN